jgi:hypothetical protein
MIFAAAKYGRIRLHARNQTAFSALKKRKWWVVRGILLKPAGFA